jgi:hypothetical protein
MVAWRDRRRLLAGGSGDAGRALGGSRAVGRDRRVGPLMGPEHS